MTRFLLAVTILNFVLTSIALAADVPESSTPAQPASASLNSVYVKLLLPEDPAAPAVEGDSTVESWIIQSIDEEQRANSRAVTGWVRLDDEPFRSTPVLPWGRRRGGLRCKLDADILERKDGCVKIDFQGMIKVTLPDEPGSRIVIPITEVKTEHRIPHVAIFIGLPDK